MKQFNDQQSIQQTNQIMKKNDPVDEAAILTFGSGGLLQTHQLADTFHGFIRYVIVLFHA